MSTDKKLYLWEILTPLRTFYVVASGIESALAIIKSLLEDDTEETAFEKDIIGIKKTHFVMGVENV